MAQREQGRRGHRTHPGVLRRRRQRIVSRCGEGPRVPRMLPRPSGRAGGFPRGGAGRRWRRGGRGWDRANGRSGVRVPSEPDPGGVLLSVSTVSVRAPLPPSGVAALGVLPLAWHSAVLARDMFRWGPRTMHVACGGVSSTPLRHQRWQRAKGRKGGEFAEEEVGNKVRGEERSVGGMITEHRESGARFHGPWTSIASDPPSSPWSMPRAMPRDRAFTADNIRLADYVARCFEAL